MLNRNVSRTQLGSTTPFTVPLLPRAFAGATPAVVAHTRSRTSRKSSTRRAFSSWQRSNVSTSRIAGSDAWSTSDTSTGVISSKRLRHGASVWSRQVSAVASQSSSGSRSYTEGTSTISSPRSSSARSARSVTAREPLRPRRSIRARSARPRGQARARRPARPASLRPGAARSASPWARDRRRHRGRPWRRRPFGRGRPWTRARATRRGQPRRVARIRARVTSRPARSRRQG